MKGSAVSYISVLGIAVLLVVLPVVVFLVGQRPGSQDVRSKANEVGSNNSSIAAPKGLVAESAYVDADLPKKNLGESEVLWVDGSSKKNSYLKFDTSSLKGKRINKATLRLYVVLGGKTQAIVNSVADTTSWNSQTLTFDNQPRVGAKVGVISGAESNKWVEVDLTKLVQDHAGEKIAVEIETSSPDGLGFSSLSASSNWPELAVE